MKNECDFCGKKQSEVASLIHGNESFICDECLEIAMEVMGRRLKVRPEDAYAEMKRQRESLAARRLQEALEASRQPGAAAAAGATPEPLDALGAAGVAKRREPHGFIVRVPRNGGAWAALHKDAIPLRIAEEACSSMNGRECIHGKVCAVAEEEMDALGVERATFP